MGSKYSKLSATRRKEVIHPTSPPIDRPPAYQSLAPTPFQRTNTVLVTSNPQRPILKTGIQASATPQWRWTNSQCREWIYAVLTAYSGLNSAEAEKLALKFDGFGPVIYYLKEEAWKKKLGDANGCGIYNIISEMRRRPGAVPEMINALANTDKNGYHHCCKVAMRIWILSFLFGGAVLLGKKIS